MQELFYSFICSYFSTTLILFISNCFQQIISNPGQEGGEEVCQAAPVRRLHRPRRLLREGHGAHEKGCLVSSSSIALNFPENDILE